MTLRCCRLLIVASLALAILGCGESNRDQAPSTSISNSRASHADDRKDEKADAEPDLSTAKSAALAWIDASWEGNASNAQQVLVDDELQRKFMDGPLRFSAALRALESAAVKQFGKPGWQVTGYPDGSAKTMEKKLQIEEEGDHATASAADAMMPLQLRRTDGKWRVDLSETARDPRAQRVGEASVAAAKVAEDVAAEIGEGKFKTVEEAKDAFRERRLTQVTK